MPRCQRTFRMLSGGRIDALTGALRWQCSFCEEAETYSAVTAPDLIQYLALALATGMRDFGRPADAARQTLLFWGVAPECVYEPAERQYNLYLQQHSDPYQARLQIGHEVFHRICSQGKIFHWTHEMLACLFSVRLLRLSGADEYADQTEYEYCRQAERCTFQEMVVANLAMPPYPSGLYGRAYCTGREWQERFGWSALCHLPRSLNKNGAPDVASWMQSFGSRLDFLEPASHFLNQK